MRSAVVVNPTKFQDPSGLQAHFTSLITEGGWPSPQWLPTTATSFGYEQTRQAIAAGAQVVFACGGDGTVRECAQALVNTDVKLAIVPAGTGNLLARALELPLEVEASLRLAAAGQTRALDVGFVDGRCFLVMTGMGLDAQMVGETSETSKRYFGWLAYLGTALSALFDRRMRLTVQIDEQRPVVRRARAVLICNTGELPGGARLIRVSPDDGQLAVAIITARTLLDWLALAWALLLRKNKIPRVDVLRGRHVAISCNAVVPRQLDGDLMGAGNTMVARVAPAALRVYCPPSAAAQVHVGTSQRPT